MSVNQLLNNLFASKKLEISGVSYAGTLNIESGLVEIKNEYFSDCTTCDASNEISKNCKNCGRTQGNNLRFLAGRGDGVYSGLSFYINNQLAGVIYVFDENNGMAEAFSSSIDWQIKPEANFQKSLIEAVEPYSDLDAFEAGTINSRFDYETVTSPGFIMGDLQASAASATVDHAFATGEYSVFLFMEPILNSLTVSVALGLGADSHSFDLGYKDAMRPRIALILKSNLKSKALKSIKLQKVDWTRQSEVWANTMVASNIGGDNAGVSSLVNAKFWWSALERQMNIAKSDADNYVSHLYHNRALGYMLSGALFGNEQCKTEIINSLAEDGPEGYTDDVLVEILKPRGLSISNEAREIVKAALKQAN